MRRALLIVNLSLAAVFFWGFHAYAYDGRNALRLMLAVAVWGGIMCAEICLKPEGEKS